MFEKECPVCGVVFKTTNTRRKYCDKCKKHPENVQRTIDSAIRRSYAVDYQPDFVEFDCELCGRHHKVPHELLKVVAVLSTSSWDDKYHFYCCVEHKQEAKHQHAKCDQCGKSLADVPGYSSKRMHNFCSIECETEYKKQHAIGLGYVHKCQYCGKEFIREKKTAYFCSNKCHADAVREGWISPASRRSDLDKIKIKRKCSFCGSMIEKSFKYEKDAIDYLYDVNGNKRERFFCNGQCSRAYYKMSHDQAMKERELQKIKDKEERRKAKEEAEKAKQEAKKKKLDPKADICSICKTPYKDCERMQSEFRIIPEGAHYNENGVLSYCPKFSTKQSKRKTKPTYDYN